MAQLVKLFIGNYYLAKLGKLLDIKIDLDVAIGKLPRNKFNGNDHKIIEYMKQQYDAKEISEELHLDYFYVLRKQKEICMEIEHILNSEDYRDGKLIPEIERKLDRQLSPEERKVVFYIINRYGYMSKLNLFNYMINREGKIQVREH